MTARGINRRAATGPNRVILSAVKNLALAEIQARFFAALRMTARGINRRAATGPNRVILSAAKNLASAEIQARFFAALRMTARGIKMRAASAATGLLGSLAVVVLCLGLQNRSAQLRDMKFASPS